MKNLLFFLTLALAGSAASNAAWSDDRRGGRDRDNAQQFEQRGNGQGNAGSRREAENRERQEQSSGDGRRQGKMTPDERRALRRQIDEAGSELYRPRR